ncbi:MAG: filamentous hemagglutinin N-terminal domain-containing protein, partial [Aquincola sp.]|nr:filamentous hemagglutinin N-terminal domain-containing protein [Aquincola sp.]
MKSSASLNTAYRLVRRADAQWVPVPETATGHGAARAGAVMVAHLLLAALPLVANAGPPGATTLPSGGSLAAGQASWQAHGNTLTVNQASQRAVIDWQRFDLGSQASVVFNQAAGRNAATLNRVLGQQPSQILGRIQAPGQVFISNPAGVIFGAGASVDVGGLVGTTMSISNADFMAGNGVWQRQGSTGAVINQGTLTAADGGYVALLAPEVRNEGVVLARAGTVALAAGESIRLDFDGPGLSSVLVTPAAIKTLVDNRQAVLAPEGLVILSARSAESLRSGVVNQAGVVDASSMVSRGGRVMLEGDSIALTAGSRIDATGATGGGSVHVGGGWQGSGPLAGATTVVMAGGASIDASATRRGDGGEVVLWSDVGRAGTRTEAQGRISARGGAEGGDGGRVETSGHTLDIRGARVDASSAKGRGGRWLLDPTDLTIDAAQAATIVTALEGGTDTAVQTANGSVIVDSGIRWTSSADLTLDAAADIHVRAPILAEHANAVLTFKYGQGAVAAGNTADYHVLAPIGLNGGPNFVTLKGSDGTPITHTVINAVGLENDSGGLTLQGMRGNLAGHYVLGSSLNIGHVAGWNSGAGFTPVGDNSTPFTGTFDGLGNTLIGLTINRPSAEYQGLFGRTQDASIRNLGLADVSITASARGGALAGVVGANTQVSTVYATGTVAGGSMLGGLAGALSSGVVVSDSYLSVNVNASGGWAGGLAGDQSGATVQRVFSTGSVSGGFNTGGLLGGKNGTVANSFTTGSLYGYNFGGTETNSGSRSASQLKQASTFASYDLANVWTIYEGQTTPLLNAFLTPVTVTAAAQKTYDGTLNAVLADATLSVPGLANQLQGTLVYGGGANSVNAGSYASTTASGLYSGQQGVRISYAPVGTLTIDPKALTVAGAAAVDKVYDRSTTATVGGTLQGVVGSDDVSLVS